MRNLLRVLPAFLLILLLLMACDGGTADTNAETSADTATDAEEMEDTAVAALKTDVVTNYADIVYASYQDSYETAVALQTALQTFVANPTEETHQAAKDTWLAAREPYGQTEVYRFYGGPIDDADGPEGLINAWPLDESYVDYVEGAPDAGIINNVADYPEINADLLGSLNEAGAEENYGLRVFVCASTKSV